MAEQEDLQAFFTVDGDELVPAPHARGPWAENMVHGRLLGGLLARAVERAHADPGLRLARFTVDLYRNSPLIPLRISSARVRDGRRIRVVDLTITAERGPVARASAVLLRSGEQPEGEIWAPSGWDVPPPDELGPPRRAEGSMFDMWPIEEASFFSGVRHRCWIRDTHPLVEGEALSPLVRVALAADMASPMAHFGSGGLRFINADYSMNLSRLPLGDPIGIESGGHLSDDGIAAGQCRLYDTAGPIGFCATSAIANPLDRQDTKQA